MSNKRHKEILKKKNTAIPNLAPEQEELVIQNVCDAVMLLYKSVKQRKIREFIEDERLKYERFKRI